MALVIAALAASAAPARAQAPPADAPREYAEALRFLEGGDTTAAIDRLREAAAAAPRFGPAYLRLGSLLSARASEVERDFAGRQEAEKALTSALQLMGDDPEVLLEWGLLLRKQNVRVDAKRVLDRAWAAAEKRGSELSGKDLARLHFTLATIYESWWEDWQGLIILPRQMISCNRLTTPTSVNPQVDSVLSSTTSVFEAAVYCPEAWWPFKDRAEPIADLKDDERSRMLEHFRLALKADPGHTEAAAHLLGHLADVGAWEEYRAISAGVVTANPEDPRALLFHALGLHSVGLHPAADSAFSYALARLTSDERRVFENVLPVLPRAVASRYAAADSAQRAEIAALFFASRDPLFLTESNERRLEHYARVAWSELKFGAPKSQLRGWDTERGNIWIRYGAPASAIQCCYGSGASSEQEVVGRKLVWSYGPTGPNFVFDRALTARLAYLSGPSNQLADQLAIANPEQYRPATLTQLLSLHPQIARFRSAEPQLTRVEIYAMPPLDSLGAMPGTRVDAGIFVFSPDFKPVWQRRHTLEVGSVPVGLAYRFDINGGSYVYGVEARVSGPDTLPRPAARARENFDVEVFPTGDLAVSDILLTAAVTERMQPARKRADLAIVPRYTTRLRAGEPVQIYFEVYGLAADEDNLAKYRAELAVENSTSRNLVQRIARGATELFRRGGSEDTRVSWRRTVPVHEDVAIDYLTIELPDVESGEFAILLRITDEATGKTIETRRRFSIRP